MAARRLDHSSCHARQGQPWHKVSPFTRRCASNWSLNCTRYFGAVVVASWPSNHPLNIGWMSENTASVGKRTVASGAVIFAANIYAVCEHTSLLPC
jgi:hypothetical protein